MNNFELAKQYFLEGLLFLEEEKFSQAEFKLKQSLEFIPDRASTLTNLSAVQVKQKKYLDAKINAEKAIFLEADNSQAHLNLGLIETELKNLASALHYFERALSLNPDYHEAWSNKGSTLHELKRYEEAIIHYDQALSLKPDYHEAWSNKGSTLHELKRYEEAIIHFDKALSLKPDYHDAWSNKGSTLHELKRYEEAIAHYHQALSLKPDINWAYGDFQNIKMKISDWSDFYEGLTNLANKVQLHQKSVQPFISLALFSEALMHRKCAEIYVDEKFPFNPALGLIPKQPKRKKIRIGYFSADFHNHATGHLMAELFELHDKSCFEIIGLSFGPKKNDEMRQRLVKSFDQFIEVFSKSDIEIAQLSRDLNIDIAVDLKGFTQDSRTGIFSYRVAPIQVNYLGYPGTMGAEYIDYIVADKTLIPSQSQQYYSEKVVYLPHSYQANDRKRAISEKKFTRQELGLPSKGFVFCCFNNNYKILPTTFNAWMQILKMVDGSVLWLLKDNPWVSENLKKEAAKQGIDATRLVFAERMSLPEHLARHRHADLFIDTLPCNAHTTASDALWTGLPVLTLMGESFASRVAASLLNSIGLSELITTSQEEYIALAIKLADNTHKLADIKRQLKQNRLTTPLFDAPLFTKNIEAAYTKMYERYQADLEPSHIYVT